MRTFNPEKELNKIQKGNKNKVILGVCLLLLIVAIGSSYALYQIKYNKRIIYTTVDKFYRKDIILSVKLDDQEKSTNKFPTKEEGYVYSHIECENGNIINDSWDTDTWNLNASIKGPDKCTVFFVKSPFHMKSCEGKEMSECLLEEGEKFTNILAFDDPDSNARYYGKDPANYIWFNCDDYENLTQENATDDDHKCEKWRIIGSFNQIVKVSADEPTTLQNLVKIRRADRIGGIAWDSSGGENGSNNWANATLKTSLENYYSGNILSSAKGITGATQGMIEQVTWQIGGISSANYPIAKAPDYYTAERGTEVSNGAQATWNGYIGLMYASDYGYATSGLKDDPITDRAGCLNTAIYDWRNETYQTNCAKNNNWLYSMDYPWTITPYLADSNLVFVLYNFGHFYHNYATGQNSVYPTLYLTYDTKITSGDGTYENPYVLST